jgi:hypothetical protein
MSNGCYYVGIDIYYNGYVMNDYYYYGYGDVIGTGFFTGLYINNPYYMPYAYIGVGGTSFVTGYATGYWYAASLDAYFNGYMYYLNADGTGYLDLSLYTDWSGAYGSVFEMAYAMNYGQTMVNAQWQYFSWVYKFQP